MIKTYGLTHIALSVKNINRSSAFYEKVFGAKKMYADENFIQLQTADSHDIIVLEQSQEEFIATSGIKHFGFRLIHQTDIKTIIEEVEKPEEKLKSQESFAPVSLMYFSMILMGMKLKFGIKPYGRI